MATMNRAPLASVKAADMNGDLDMRTSKDFEMPSKPMYTYPSSAASSSSCAVPYGVDLDMDREVGTSCTTIYRRMREVENDGRIYDANAKYLRYRRVLVDWICECGEEQKLNSSTMHVAVGYMDKVLQLMEVKKDRFQLVAIACLIIAAKYEEKEEAVPSADKLSQYTHAQGQYNDFCSTPMIHQMEVLLLNRLNWSLSVVAPIHYVGYFHRKGVLYQGAYPQGDTVGYKPLAQNVVAYMKKYMDFFADLCLQEYAFHRYAPSLLAAAMVLASRKALNIRPLWNASLSSTLGYAEADVWPVYTHVWEYYANNFPDEAKRTQKQEEQAERNKPISYSAHDSSVRNQLQSPMQISSPAGAVSGSSFGNGSGLTSSGVSVGSNMSDPRITSATPMNQENIAYFSGSSSGISIGSAVQGFQSSLSSVVGPHRPHGHNDGHGHQQHYGHQGHDDSGAYRHLTFSSVSVGSAVYTQQQAQQQQQQRHHHQQQFHQNGGIDVAALLSGPGGLR